MHKLFKGLVNPKTNYMLINNKLADVFKLTQTQHKVKGNKFLDDVYLVNYTYYGEIGFQPDCSVLWEDNIKNISTLNVIIYKLKFKFNKWLLSSKINKYLEKRRKINELKNNLKKADCGTETCEFITAYKVTKEQGELDLQIACTTFNRYYPKMPDMLKENIRHYGRLLTDKEKEFYKTLKNKVDEHSK